MSWPALTQLSKWVDVSWWQNNGPPEHEPFDVDAFFQANPQVEGGFIRAIWNDGSVDEHYPHYFDGFSRNGRKVAAYLWPNITKTIDQVVEDWQVALGDRVPPLLALDFEETSQNAGRSRADLTANMQASFDALRATFPEATVIGYSRASWLDEHINVGTWFHELRWWLAHWIFPGDLGREAFSFEEVDGILPIDNDRVPWRGNVVRIEPDNVVGWQFSSKGQLARVNTAVDLDYFLRSFLDEVYDEDGEEPEPTPSERLRVIAQRLRAAMEQAVNELEALADELET